MSSGTGTVRIGKLGYATYIVGKSSERVPVTVIVSDNDDEIYLSDTAFDGVSDLNIANTYVETRV